MPIPTLPPIPSISEITDRAWRMAEPIVTTGEAVGGRAIDLGRRAGEIVVDGGRRAAEPLVETGGRIADTGARLIEPVIDNAGRIVSRGAEIGERTLRGIGSETADLVEQIVRRLMQVTNDSIDAMVNRARETTNRTLEFVESVVRDSAVQIDSEVDRAFRVAEDIASEIARIPGEALELIGSGEEVLHRARERSASIRRYMLRFRERRRTLPRIVAEHIEELAIEIEDELEAAAIEAEELGEKVFNDSRELYERTVEDAERYGTLLIRQTEDTRRRGRELRASVVDGREAVKDWARQRVTSIVDFARDRVRGGLAIRSAEDAERWSTDAISSVYQLATEFEHEALTRPEDVMNFARRRVDDAVALAMGVHTGVMTARDWLGIQRGHNAAWRRSMVATRSMAEDFLRAQGVRLEMRVLHHAGIIADTARNLGVEQLTDTVGEVMGTAGDASIIAWDAAREFAAEAGRIAGFLETEPLPPTPPPPRTFRVREIPVPEREEEDPIPAAGMDGAAAGANPPDQVHVRRQNRTPEAGAAGARQNAPAAGRAGAQASNTPAAGSAGAAAAAGSNVKPSAGQAGAGVGANASPVAGAAARAGGEAASPPPTPPAESEKSSTATKATVHTNTTSTTSTETSSLPAATGDKPATNQSKEKPKPKPALKPDSQVKAGTSLPKVEKKSKPTKKEADSAATAPTAAAAQKPEENKPKPNASEKPESAKPKPSVSPAAKDPKKAADAMKPPTKEEEPKLAGKTETADTKPLAKANIPKPQKKDAEKAAPEDPKVFQEKLTQAGGSGSPLDPATRTELDSHLGFDLTGVRLHTGPTAQAAAKSLGAEAFTIGRDIFFAEGKYDPRSAKGLGLLAHEATHVAQQMGMVGSKMRFSTPTGGDDMEQEAQEVGERVASNLAYGQGLRVGRYIRTYEPADDEPVSTGVQLRLDGLSMRALSKAGQLLSTQSRPRPIRLDEVTVDIQIDLEDSSDAEIIDQWAEAIVAAVEAANPTSPNTIQPEEVLAPATHVLQKKLGDPGQEPADEPPPKVDPEVMARILKITPSAQDKDMIRKLLVREHVDDMVAASKRKQRQEEYENSGAHIVPRAGMMPRYSGAISEDDRAAIEAKLKEYDISSYEDFAKLKTDFVTAFENKGVNIVNYMLDENLKIVLEQKKRYLSRDKKDPDAPINTIKTSAKEVKKAMDVYIAHIYASLDRFHWFKIGPRTSSPTYGNLDSVTERIVDAVDTDTREKIIQGYKTFSKVRQSHGDKHPILLGRDFNPDTILNEKDDGDLELKLFHHFADVEKDIRYARGEMSPKKFWELPPMVAMTRQQLGVRDGEGAAKTIDETQKQKAADERFWAILQAAAAIALAVTAMVATGGLAAVAMVGSAGLSVYSAAKAADDYMFKAAAVNSSLDQAKLISKDEPSLLWLAIELIGAGLDVAGAVGAFGKLARIAKSAVSDKAALKELEDVARQAYKDSKITRVAEDDFVARLLESAKKGVGGVEDMVKQAKLATELLEGTSARAVAIMKGDRAAIQSLVTEYGNWKGLMGSLTNGGEDAAKMSKNIGAWRNEIVADMKAKGAAPLEDASAEVVSDFDLNVVPKDGKGAGERLIELEKEMAGKYGPNWSESLLMNFYTDKSQLLSVEEALKLVNPQKRAQIMARVTEKSEKLNFAKMLEHAGDNPSAVQQVEELMAAAGVKYDVGELREIAKSVKDKGRDSLLLEVDKKISELKALPENSPARVAKAEEITQLQMEANFLTKEAYISPAAVKGGTLTAAEAYTNALSQLEMIRHVIHDSGGDILKACREYELFKYINRYTAAAQKAGVKSPGLTYFEGLSAYVYKRARSAHMETGHLPGVTPADEAMEAAVDGKYLLEQYSMFREEVNKTLPQMKEAAQKNPAGGWKGEGPKKAGPAAGGEPPAKRFDSVKPPENLYTPPPMDPAKAAALPAAAIKTVQAAEKMAEGKGAKNQGILGPHSAVTSAGFGATGAYQGIGMFRTHIPGVKQEVIVTVMPVERRTEFEKQLAAALAAAKTGIGPKVHGKVEMGEKKLAFAMDDVKGGYADAYNDKAGEDIDKSMAKSDMMSHAKNITPQTFQDLDTFRNSIFESGFYYVGPVDGFVTPDGRWKPINFYNAVPMSEDTVIHLARNNHDLQFDTLRHKLMENHMAVKREEAKP